MTHIRIIALLFLLLSSSGFSFGIPSGIDKISLENENGYHLSEDFQDVSYSNLVTPLNLFTKRITHSATPLITSENFRVSSRVKGYFSTSYLIEPGLGLEKIIFPFHSFL